MPGALAFLGSQPAAAPAVPSDDDARFLLDNYDSIKDPAQQEHARAILHNYTQAKAAAGLQPFQPSAEDQRKAHAKLEGLYGGIDKIDAQLPAESLAAISSTLNPQESKARLVNQMYVIGNTKDRPEVAAQVDADWPSVRAQVGKSLGMSNPDITDVQLYNGIGTKVKAIQEERGFAAQLSQHIQQETLEGNFDWLKSYQDFAGKQPPGYDPAHADQYRQIAQASFQAVADKAHIIGPVVRTLSSIMEQSKKNPNPLESDDDHTQEEAMIDALAPLSPADREQALTLASARAGRTQGPDRGGVEKAGISFTRGVTSLTDATSNVVAKVVDRWSADDDVQKTLEDRRVIKGQLMQHYFDQADPLTASNAMVKGLYNTAAMIPQLALAANPVAGVPVLLSTNVDSRTRALEAKGVPGDQASLVGLAQGTIDTALNFVTSNMVFGKIPGKLAGSAADGMGSLFGRVAKIAGIEAGTLTAATIAQQVSPLIVEDLASKFSKSIPGVDWDKQFTGMKNAAPETIATLLPLILLGTGSAAFREGQKFSDYTSDVTSLKSVGFDETMATKLAAISDPEARIAEIQKMWGSADPGTPEAREAVAQMDAAAEQRNVGGAKIMPLNGVEQQPERALNLDATPEESVSGNPTGYKVVDQKGQLIDYASTPEEAQQLADQHNSSQPQPVTDANPLPAAVDDGAVERSAQAMGISANGDAAKLVLDAWGKLSNNRRQFLNLVKSRDAKGAWATEFGAQENKADIYARQLSTGIADDLNRAMDREVGTRNAKDEQALTFMVEAQNNRAQLEKWRNDLESAVNPKNPNWVARAKSSIDHALANFDRISSVASRYTSIQDAHLQQERAMGLNVDRRAGYVRHLQDVSEDVGLPFTEGKGSSAGTGFKKAREYDSFVDSILAGVKPKTLNAVTALESRLGAGQRTINRQLWASAGRTILDPATAAPLVSDMVETTRQLDGKEIPQMNAPAGYEPRMIGNQTIAVRKGYTGIYDALIQPSAVENSTAAKAIGTSLATAKSMMLFFDTFHLGRLAYHQLALRGSASYSKGLLLLDHTLPELQQMVANKEVDLPPKFSAQLLEHKANLDMLLDNGLNAAAVGDNLYTDIIHKLPLIGMYNKFLFDKFQRGGMVQTALIELERMKNQLPEMEPGDVAARVAKDLNIRFGNLGKQSWIKSRTFVDLARMLALAPGWNEGLLRSEIGAAGQIIETGKEAITNQRLVSGTLQRNIGALLVGQFMANQVINYITRGHPTWENPEEGVGAKMSAWIPDVFGHQGHNSPGLFLNPFSLPAEITGQYMAAMERGQGPISAATTVASYKLGPLGRALDILLTKTDQGKPIVNDKELAKHVGSALIPLPIQTGTIVKAVKSLRSGEVTQSTPGQLEKQGLASVGIKAESAPSVSQRILRLASDYATNAGKPLQPPTGDNDYTAFRHALATGNKEDVKDELKQLLTKRTPAEIQRAFTGGLNRPFTGSSKLEAGFMKSLSGEQKDTYKQALVARREMAKAALQALHQAHAQAPDESDSTAE